MTILRLHSPIEACLQPTPLKALALIMTSHDTFIGDVTKKCSIVSLP